IGCPGPDPAENAGVVAISLGGQGVDCPVLTDELDPAARGGPNARVRPDEPVRGLENFDTNGVSTLGRYFNCRRAWYHDAANPGQKRDHHAESLFRGRSRL